MNSKTKKVANPKLHLAVLAALPLMAMASFDASAACTTTTGVVNCSGNTLGGSNGAVLIAPGNYKAMATDPALEANSTVLVGNSRYPSTSGSNSAFDVIDIASSAVGSSVPNFTVLNIGSGSTDPTYGNFDPATTLVTGLKAVPGGFNDVFNGLKPLLNYEGLDILQPGTVNNFGKITNFDGVNYLVTNGPKIYTEGGADNLPYRTLGAWLNGSDTTLNNYGVIDLKVNNASLTNATPAVTADVPGAWTTGLLSSASDALDGTPLTRGTVITDGTKYFLVTTAGAGGTSPTLAIATSTALTKPSDPFSWGTGAKLLLIGTTLGASGTAAAQKLNIGELVTVGGVNYTVTTAGNVSAGDTWVVPVTPAPFTLSNGAVLTPTSTAMYQGNAASLISSAYAYATAYPTARDWAANSSTTNFGLVVSDGKLYQLGTSSSRVFLGATAPTNTIVGSAATNGTASLTYLGAVKEWAAGSAVTANSWVRANGVVYLVTAAGELGEAPADAPTASVTTTVASGSATLQYLVSTLPGMSKPVTYGVLITADGDNFYDNVTFNNHNKLTVTQDANTSGITAPIALMVKENILNAQINNANGAVIEGVSNLALANSRSKYQSAAFNYGSGNPSATDAVKLGQYVVAGGNLYSVKTAGSLATGAPSTGWINGEVVSGSATLSYVRTAASPDGITSNIWTSAGAVTLNSYIVSGGSLYKVTTAGTLDTVAPVHITGSQANGTATLQYISPISTAVSGISSTTLSWVGTKAFAKGSYITAGGNLYLATADVTLGSIPPVHTSGVVSSLSYVGPSNMYFTQGFRTAAEPMSISYVPAVDGAGASTNKADSSYNGIYKNGDTYYAVNTANRNPTTGTALQTVDIINATGITFNTYSTASGSAIAVSSDNNSDYISLTNDGTIQSYQSANALTAFGTAMSFSNQRTLVYNTNTGRINGDILTSNQANEFTFKNAGILNGNIQITPNVGNGVNAAGQGAAGSLQPYLFSTVSQAITDGLDATTAATLTRGDYYDLATPRNVENKVVIQPVINASGGNGSSFVPTDNSKVGVISGSVYVAAGGSYSNGHPFGLYVNPIIASGVTVKSGDTYQFAAENIAVAAGALATANNTTCTASTTTGCVTKQIDASNIHTDLASGDTGGLLTWAFATGKTNTVVAHVADASTISGISSTGATTLNNLMTFDNVLGSELQNLATNEEVRKAGEQLRPEANNASTQAAMSAANQVSSVIGAHQEAVRTASNGNSGVSTGEAAQGAGFWMQGFGFKGEQKERGGVDGYTADTGGFVLGGDKAIGNGDVRVGAAFAYASTGIDGKGTTSANRTDIDSYQGTVYGSYNAGAWYVDAALGYGQHQYDTKRYVALAGASITGKHDANQYLAKVGVGYPLAFGKATFTPLASLAYVNLDQDGYTETDPTASGAALTVGSTKTDSLRSGLGAKVSVPLSTGALNTALEARAVWNHEFADTQQDIASSFVGGTSFTTNGVAQARDSANLGLGVSLNSANGQTLSVNYDAEVKSDYVSHTAAFKFRYDF